MKVEPDGNEFYTACKRLIGDGQTVSPFYVWTRKNFMNHV